MPYGAYLLDTMRSGLRRGGSAPRRRCPATGGANQVYLYSTNPYGASGDGIAMAWRAGCRVANMEFRQFHPDRLWPPRNSAHLPDQTEALRGEGALLRRRPPGERFMPRFDTRGELAPRDIVARAIDHEMKRLGLHARPAGHHPQAGGLHPASLPPSTRTASSSASTSRREPIPVVPSAHFTCGGVLTDLAARTDLEGLYAIGEVACTGPPAPTAWPATRCWNAWYSPKPRPRDLHAELRRAIGAARTEKLGRKPRDRSDEDVVVAHNWQDERVHAHARDAGLARGVGIEAALGDRDRRGLRSQISSAHFAPRRRAARAAPPRWPVPMATASAPL